MTILEIYDIIKLASSKPGNEKQWWKSQKDFFSLNLTEPRILITGKINILYYWPRPNLIQIIMIDRIWNPLNWSLDLYVYPLANERATTVEDHTSVMLTTSPSVKNDASWLTPLMIAITDIYIMQLKQICRYFTNLLNL